MTTAPARGAVPAAGAGPAPGLAPVVVLTYAHAGADRLTQVLSASPALACTASTGLLPLCQSAAATWQRVEDRGVPSALALQTVRSMAGIMASVVLSRAGAARWCETALAPPAAAATFLRVFPAAMFVCLHRSLHAVLAESTRAYPWGLGGSPFWAHAGARPGSNVTTVAAYWAAHTEPLLDFEAAHPASCLRVRHEDLVAGPDDEGRRILASLGLRAPGGIRSHRPAVPGDRDEPDEELPQLAGHLPAPLRAKVTELYERLGYTGFPPW